MSHAWSSRYGSVALLLVFGSGCAHTVGYRVDKEPVVPRLVDADVVVRLAVTDRVLEGLASEANEECTLARGYRDDLGGQISAQVARHLDRVGVFRSASTRAEPAGGLLLRGSVRAYRACVVLPANHLSNMRTAAAIGGLVGVAVHAGISSGDRAAVESQVVLADVELVRAEGGEVLWSGAARHEAQRKIELREIDSAYDTVDAALREAVHRMIGAMASDFARPPAALVAPAGAHYGQPALSACPSCPRPSRLLLGGVYGSVTQARAARDAVDRRVLGAGFPYLATTDELALVSSKLRGVAVVLAAFARPDEAQRWMSAYGGQHVGASLVEVRDSSLPAERRIVELDGPTAVQALTASGTVACALQPGAAFLVAGDELDAAPPDLAPVRCGSGLAFVPREATRWGSVVRVENEAAVLLQVLRHTGTRTEVGVWSWEGGRRGSRLETRFH